MAGRRAAAQVTVSELASFKSTHCLVEWGTLPQPTRCKTPSPGKSLGELQPPTRLWARGKDGRKGESVGDLQEHLSHLSLKRGHWEGVGGT